MWKVGISVVFGFVFPCFSYVESLLCSIWNSTFKHKHQNRRSLGISSWLNDFLFLLSYRILHHQLFHCECSFSFMNNKFMLSSVQSRKCLGVVSEWQQLKRRMQNVNLCAENENQPGVSLSKRQRGNAIYRTHPTLFAVFVSFFCSLYLQLL